MEVRTRSPCGMKPGTSGSEPVAMMNLDASITVPASSPAATTSCLRLRNSPRPEKTVTPAAFSSPAMPLRSLPITSSLRASIFFQSGRISPEISTPNSAARRAVESTSAPAIRVLVGMQPTLRQVPPKNSFSTSAVLRPLCPARIAATYPPGPAPITQTSNFSTFLLPVGVGIDRPLSKIARFRPTCKPQTGNRVAQRKKKRERGLRI